MTALNTEIFAGVDWGNTQHRACIVDANGQVLAQAPFEQSVAGLVALTTWLLAHGTKSPQQINIAIERPDGPVVEVLLAGGFAVFSLNPKQLDRFRDRHTVAGAKDDRRDALVLADSLRTDMRAFRRVLPLDAELIELTELIRIEEDLRRDENGLINRFREQLSRYAPRLLDLMASRADPFFWALIEATIQSPPPSVLSTDEIDALLRKHRVRRLNAQQVRDALQTTQLPISEGTLGAVKTHLNLLLPRLKLVHAQRVQCQKQMEKMLQTATKTTNAETTDWRRDAAILASLPGVGTLTLATLIAEAHEPIAGRDLATLRSWGGVAPVTRQSGKSRSVSMRRACNPRLRFAYYHWARVAVIRDPASKRHYARLRAKGHSHGRALRGVMDRLLTVTVAMLRSGITYQPEQRGQDKRVA